LTVDQRTFEKDVASDWLGGLLVENLLLPYDPLANRNYLWEQDVAAKKRTIMEILGNLVLEYPEMSHELLIQPEYFMFETMARKASLFPLIAHRFLTVLRGESRAKNTELVMNGFTAALNAIAEEGYLSLCGGHVRIAKEYIDRIQRRRLRVVNLLKTVRNSILRPTFEIFPNMMRSFMEDYRLRTKHLIDSEVPAETQLAELEDPKKYVFVPTSLGLAALSDKVTIEDFVKKIIPRSQEWKVDVRKLSGVLNAVYTLRVQKETEEETIVAKVFKDWYGWKWFPLALWALGTRGFAVLGKSRLEREYAMNRFLTSQGVNVPRLIYVSPRERLIFQEYVDGENMTEVVKRICSSREGREGLMTVVRQVGREIAKVHELGAALGDCKPENIILAKDGRIYFVDLEQSQRGGDQTWDIAEFMYYSGHYAFFSPIETAQAITREFVTGYLEGGGEAGNIGKARSPQYIKVFSFFTPPHILFAIATTCGEMLGSVETEK